MNESLPTNVSLSKHESIEPKVSIPKNITKRLIMTEEEYAEKILKIYEDVSMFLIDNEIKTQEFLTIAPMMLANIHVIQGDNLEEVRESIDRIKSNTLNLLVAEGVK